MPKIALTDGVGDVAGGVEPSALCDGVEESQLLLLLLPTTTTTTENIEGDPEITSSLHFTSENSGCWFLWNLSCSEVFFNAKIT